MFRLSFQQTDAALIHVEIMVNVLLMVTDINVFVDMDTLAANVKVSITSRDFFRHVLGDRHCEMIFCLSCLTSWQNSTNTLSLTFVSRKSNTDLSFLERQMNHNIPDIYDQT
jgi:hypothetical protein